jgi:hypothetical protein
LDVVHRLWALVAPVSVLLAAAGLASAATAVPGFVSGPVTAVGGSTFKVQTSSSPTGSSTVSVSSTTAIVEQVVGTRSALKDGVCVVANGPKNSNGTVAAARITVSEPVKGACGGGFAGRGGTRAGRPGGVSSFGFAAGKISAVKGDTVTVHGTGASTTVTVSGKTQVLVQRDVTRAAIAVKTCASVRGTSSDGGVTVKAQRVDLSKPTATGCTSGGRHRP